MKTTVSIPGIHCASCAALIKDVSSDFPAIRQVEVDIATKNVTLDHDDGLNMSEWSAAIEALDPKYRIQPTPSV